jgi:tRNA 2-selenouridine synthase
MVAHRIAEHLERDIQGHPQNWRPLVYCWRGGQRSGSMAWFLSQVGFRTLQLKGGYKAFRALVREQLNELPLPLQFTVLCGRTGSGKTRLLHALTAAGAQVLDLEALAGHRGSVLGGLRGRAQPSQKAFETDLWHQLRQFDPARPVYVESESGRIGKLRVPELLIQRMHDHSRCLLVTLPMAERVRLLLDEYAYFADDPAHFCQLLDNLVELRGKAQVQHWQALAQGGQWSECFEALMAQHYDPLYDRSMKKHFSALADAPLVALAGADAATFDAAAQLVMGL